MNTLSGLRTMIRQRADQENSQFISDIELNSYINQSYYELYDLLVSKYGNDYYVAPAYPIVTTANQTTYPLPANFYKLLGVDLFTQGQTSPISLKPFNFQNRNRNHLLGNAVPISEMRYKIAGSTIWFTPQPSGQTVQIWYVPRMTLLVADTDQVDGISGWDEYIVIDCMIKCLQKEESDVGLAVKQKMDIIKRINDSAANRDAGYPATVTDTTPHLSAYGVYFVDV